MIEALNNPAARTLIDAIEDMRASWNGDERYEAEIAICIAEIAELTGWTYTL